MRTLSNGGGGYLLYEYDIDGCQYIGNTLGGSATLTHKGSCTNPIHRCPCNSIDSTLMKDKEQDAGEIKKKIP